MKKKIKKKKDYVVVPLLELSAYPEIGMIPDETSLICEVCGCFNFEDGVLREGKFYCNKCWDEKIKELLGELNSDKDTKAN
jgi:hypothetical protein